MPSSRLRESTTISNSAGFNQPIARSTRPKERKSYAQDTGSDSDEDDDDEIELDDDDETPDEGAPEDDAEFYDDDDHDDKPRKNRVPRSIESDDDADDGLPLDVPKRNTASGEHIGSSATSQFDTRARTTQPQIRTHPVEAQEVRTAGTSKSDQLRLNDDDDDDDDDDEELSEPDDEELEATKGKIGIDGRIDAGEEEEEDDEDEDASDPEDSEMDVSKLTKRQRTRYEQEGEGGFLQLPMEPQIRKHLTAEEHAMRRAEMARRRKNLSEKRDEEIKLETINKLLKKQAPKRRGKMSAKEIEAQDREDDDGEGDEDGENDDEAGEAMIKPANPVYTRWVSKQSGISIGVPHEWLEGPSGAIFGGPVESPAVVMEG